MPTTTGLQWQFVDARDALKQDAKLNAAKAIVAERLVTALERIQHYKIGKLTGTHAVGAMQEVATAALTAWCELSGN